MSKPAVITARSIAQLAEAEAWPQSLLASSPAGTPAPRDGIAGRASGPLAHAAGDLAPPSPSTGLRVEWRSREASPGSEAGHELGDRLRGRVPGGPAEVRPGSGRVHERQAEGEVEKGGFRRDQVEVPGGGHGGPGRDSGNRHRTGAEELSERGRVKHRLGSDVEGAPHVAHER